MLEKIYGFWFEKRPATSLGLIRILFGLVTLLSLTYNISDFSAFYTTEGFAFSENFPAQFNKVPFLDSLLHFLSPHILYAVLIVVMVFFTLGYKTRYLKFLQFILLVHFNEINLQVLNSGNLFATATSFYLMLSPCGESLSLDSLSARTTKKIPVWHLRLFQFQLVVIYLFSSLAKLPTTLWINGTALNFALRNGSFSRFNMDWIASPPFVTSLLTWSFLFFLFSFPFLMWFKDFRKPLLAVGVFMHLGILVFMDVGWFSLFVLSVYPAFFNHNDLAGAGRIARTIICGLKVRSSFFQKFSNRDKFMKRRRKNA